jgi:hypothetical protein
VSLFFCAECQNLRDSDDGCEEAPLEYQPPHQLLCVECVAEMEGREVAAILKAEGK